MQKLGIVSHFSEIIYGKVKLTKFVVERSLLWGNESVVSNKLTCFTLHCFSLSFRENKLEILNYVHALETESLVGDLLDIDMRTDCTDQTNIER
jgi:hypothetical protein